MNAADLIGMKFGRLTVVSRGENSKSGKAMWICVCDCGKRKAKTVGTYELKSGKVQSCGCLYFESNKGRRITHGKSGSRLYRIWQGMRRRCDYASGVAFQNYGGRGINVCEEWLSDFHAFYSWAMENGYSDGLTLDRKDSNGNYCPENCRWATMKAQQNNRRNNRIIEYGGEEYTLSELAAKLNVRPETLGWRIDHGWSEKEYALAPNSNNRIIRGNIA